jgi:hypothetical protein
MRRLIHALTRNRAWTDPDSPDARLRGRDYELGMTRVDVSSQSRVGRGDLGTNARRIARFLHALDRKLQPGGRGGTSRK